MACSVEPYGMHDATARAGDALALGAVGLLELLLVLEGGEGGDQRR